MTLSPLRFAHVSAIALALLTFTAASGVAQQTAGAISGRVVDQDRGALPGAQITVTNVETGFARSVGSDAEGLYRLPLLPPGTYVVSSELDGFSRLELPAVVVHVSQTTDLQLEMRLARLAETITVSGRTALIPTTSSSIGEVVDLQRVQGLPLNGRQFANLAALVPGVGIGFHSDATKPLQYSPQVSGGNGRNINYLVDGGDNNDDTVGGLLQQVPLEAIQEFNFITHRFDAQFGRSNGGVLNVLTRTGTNDIRGSWFTFLRDESMNATTMSEKRPGSLGKQPYGRWQFGGSLGGPIVANRSHYFLAVERTQQDTKQIVDTLGLFPAEDGVYDTPVRQNLLTAKVTSSAGPNHYLAFRYAVDVNSQPNGPALRVAPSAWTVTNNDFHSLNASDNWVVGGTKLNELVIQYARYRNDVPGTGTRPMLVFPNGVRSGASNVAPQSTEQDKWHLRNDLSWSATGFGVGHDFKAGVNWIREPHLTARTEALFTGMYQMGGDSLNAAVTSVQVFGGTAAVNIPLDMFGVYIKDDWRLTNRLTLNLGLRWDYVSGMPIDQSSNPNFAAMQAAGATGRFEGTALAAFGQEPEGDKDNVQPRLGFAYDVRGDGRDVVRGGWGIYTDFAYTNANALTPAFDAAGAGLTFSASDPTGLKKPDGTLFLASDPLSAIAGLNTVNPNLRPMVGVVLSPRIKQPYTRQASIGWAHEIDPRTTVVADYVHVTGHDLNLRFRPNMLVNGQRVLAGIPIQPNNNQFRTVISGGTSRYDALTVSIRRRMANTLDLSAWYTRSKATTTIGSASDELNLDIVQNAQDPFGDIQDGPSSRTDAPNRVMISAIVSAPWGVQVAPIFMFRSGLPMQTQDGRDLNGDSNANDITPLAYRYTGIDDQGVATFEEAGPCETVNCSRRAPLSQLNLRVSRGFTLGGARIDAIVEVFNLLNKVNPVLPASSRVRSSSGALLASFMQPEAYAGDFRQTEQRVGQLAFRISF